MAREERRVVTVLFADLVGFTEQAETMDPEDVRKLLAGYYDGLRGELERHGGTVEKFIGDAVMAVFGTPTAHEDDPERAVRAALAIRDWAERRDGVRLRVGVNTGEVLVSFAPNPSGLAMVAGDIVNTASRIQSAADANGVLVGEATQRATRDAFDYVERPAIEAKGKSQPVRVWQPIAVRRGVGEGRRIGEAPLVGRDRELGLLRAAYERARDHAEPQLVTLVGVPGLGKTRLAWELAQEARDGADPPHWVAGRSLPYGAAVPYWSVGELVKAIAGIEEGDSADAANERLHAAAVAAVGDVDASWVEMHLRPLLGLAAAESHEDRRDEAFAAWRRFFEGVAESRPLVLAFDDLHWADDGVLDFIDHLVTWATGVPVLVLATARPELLARRPAWGGGKPNALTISLTPLSDDETARLVRSLRGHDLAPEDEEMLLARAAGNPLYAEEFALMAREGSAGGIPASVQGIIAARLDGLDLDERDLLHDAAVVGDVFSRDALAYLGGRNGGTLDAALHRLELGEFVRRRRRTGPAAGELEYAFRHPLIRDVAYERIPRAVRSEKHRLAAEWLRSVASERASEWADLLAHHAVQAASYARAAGEDAAELERDAVAALREAGDRARALNALDTAAERYAHALELLDEDAGDKRAELRLAVAEVLLRTGTVAESAEHVEAVIEAARASGRADLLGRAALAAGGVGVEITVPDERLIALLEEALAALGDSEPALRARLLGRLAVEVYYVPPPSRRERLSEEAVATARAVGSQEALADALNARRAAIWSPVRLEERLDASRELVALADALDDRERSLQGRNWLIVDLVEAGRLDEARSEIGAYAELVEPLGMPAYSWWAPMWRAMVANLEGRFEDGARLGAEAAAVGEAAGQRNAPLFYEIQSFVVAEARGVDLESLLPVMQAGIARGNAAWAFRCGLAWTYAQLGRAAEAAGVLDELGPLESIPVDMNWPPAIAELTRALALLGDAGRAATAYELLRPFAARTLLIARAAACFGSAESYLGLLAATAGRFEQAVRHYEVGLAADERVGAAVPVALTKGWLAESLLALGRPARALAREAVDDAARLGLRPPAAAVLEAAG